MKDLLKYWENGYYTVLVSFLLAVIGLLVSIFKRKQNKKLKPLLFFFLGFVVIELIYFYDMAANISQPLRNYLFYYPDFIDTIVEFLAFFYVIKNYIEDRRVKKRLTPLQPVFIGVLLIYFTYYTIIHKEIDQYFLQMIFTIQACFLITACILYYIDLFRKDPKLNLTADPSFWVVTGLAFFVICTLPFSFLGLYLTKLNYRLYVRLFIIFEVFYWILFSMVIKAYLCKPTTA